MAKNKKMLDRLQELEAQAERKKFDYGRAVINCMTTAELKEICAMYDNESVDEKRINEIWERAENEYKQRHTKADKSS